MNLKDLDEDEYKKLIQFKKDCLSRHYENMDIGEILTIKSGFEKDGRPTKKSLSFIEKINKAKGYNIV